VISGAFKTFSSAVMAVLFVVGAFTPLDAAKAETALGGPITSNTTITAAGGPYLVTATIFVPSGLALTVEPGAVFQAADTFNYSPFFDVTMGGTLTVGGSGSSTIFRGRNSTLIYNEGQANFNNVELLDLQALGYFANAGGGIVNSEIRSTPCGNQVRGIAFTGNVLKASPCTFASNISGNLFLASPTQTNNCAVNANAGIVITGNEFRGFTANNALCAWGNFNVDATSNYWGTTSALEIASMVLDKNDTASGSVTTVDVANALSSKPAGVPEPWAALSVPSKTTLSATSQHFYFNTTVNVGSFSDGGLGLVACEIRSRDVASLTWLTSRVNCGSSFVLYVGWGLNAHVHEVQFRALNDEGWSPWSDSLNLIYGDPPPAPSAVYQVTGNEIKTNSATVKWTIHPSVVANCAMPNAKASYCPLDDFVVRYSEDPEGPWTQSGSSVKANGKLEYQFTIRGLSQAKLYYVLVGSENVAGIRWRAKPLEVYTAGTLEQKVQVLQSNGVPLKNASLAWSRIGGGFSTAQNVKTNDEGWATFPAVPAGPGTLYIVDAKLSSGLKLQSQTSFSVGRKAGIVKIPAEPTVGVFNVNVRTVDSSGIARALVQIQNTREGLPVDLSRCNINGFTFILPKGASSSTAYTTNEGLAMFYGLVDYNAKTPYQVNVDISAGTLKATQSVPLKSSSQGVWFPYLPYVNAIWSHFSGQNGAEVPVTLYGHNAVFTPSADASKLPDDQKMSVSVIGPDGASTSCDKSTTNPTAYFDDQGHGQLAFCPRAAGYYQLVGNGILAGQSELLLPQGSVPSIPRAGELLPSRKWSTVTWQAPEFNVDGTKMSYSVAFKASGTSKWKACKVAKLKASCKKFTTGRKYDIAIAAKNKFGWSPNFTFSVTAP